MACLTCTQDHEQGKRNTQDVENERQHDLEYKKNVSENEIHFQISNRGSVAETDYFRGTSTQELCRKQCPKNVTRIAIMTQSQEFQKATKYKRRKIIRKRSLQQNIMHRY